MLAFLFVSSLRPGGTLPSQGRKISGVHFILTDVPGGDRATSAQDSFILRLFDGKEVLSLEKPSDTGASCCLLLGQTSLLSGTYLDLFHNLCFGRSSSPQRCILSDQHPVSVLLGPAAHLWETAQHLSSLRAECPGSEA